eukprot:10114-Prymnesium_polylepis.1
MCRTRRGCQPRCDAKPSAVSAHCKRARGRRRRTRWTRRARCWMAAKARGRSCRRPHSASTC